MLRNNKQSSPDKFKSTKLTVEGTEDSMTTGLSQAEINSDKSNSKENENEDEIAKEERDCVIWQEKASESHVKILNAEQVAILSDSDDDL